MVKIGIEAIDFFVIFTVYHPLEIIATGGTTAFGKLTGHTPERLKDMLVGEPLTEEEYPKALKMLKK